MVFQIYCQNYIKLQHDGCSLKNPIFQAIFSAPWFQARALADTSPAQALPLLEEAAQTAAAGGQRREEISARSLMGKAQGAAWGSWLWVGQGVWLVVKKCFCWKDMVGKWSNINVKWVKCVCFSGRFLSHLLVKVPQFFISKISSLGCHLHSTHQALNGVLCWLIFNWGSQVKGAAPSSAVARCHYKLGGQFWFVVTDVSFLGSPEHITNMVQWFSYIFLFSSYFLIYSVFHSHMFSCVNGCWLFGFSSQPFLFDAWKPCSNTRLARLGQAVVQLELQEFSMEVVEDLSKDAENCRVEVPVPVVILFLFIFVYSMRIDSDW